MRAVHEEETTKCMVKEQLALPTGEVRGKQGVVEAAVDQGVELGLQGQGPLGRGRQAQQEQQKRGAHGVDQGRQGLARPMACCFMRRLGCADAD